MGLNALVVNQFFFQKNLPRAADQQVKKPVRKLAERDFERVFSFFRIKNALFLKPAILVEQRPIELAQFFFGKKNGAPQDRLPDWAKGR